MQPGVSQAVGNLSTYLEIRRIVSTDLHAVARFFTEVVETGMKRTFHPHAFDFETAQHICNYGGTDWYGACLVCNGDTERMVGYVMLRGWDAGYTTPSFGVSVLPDYQGSGLGRTLLSVAILVARLRGSPAIRLKVYPDNRVAIALYQSVGFKFGDDLEEGQMVGYLKLRGVGNTTDTV